MIKIPAPPQWLMIAIVLASFIVLAINIAHSDPLQQYQAPGGYAGRPPTAGHWPGKCWCQFHGPRGGCKKWVCPHR